MLPHLLALLSGCDPGSRALTRPNRVAVGVDGTVWVSDFANDRVVRWAADGRFLGTWGRNGLGRDELWRLTAMAPLGTGLLVANLRPLSNVSGADVVTELKVVGDDGETGAAQLDGRTLEAGARIHGLAVLPSGELVLADSIHGELVQVTPEGRHVGRFGGILRPDAEPYAVTASGADVWVVERDRHRVTVVSPGGRERTFVPVDEPLLFPTAVAVCAVADPPWVVIADHGNHRVRRFLLDGTPLSAFTPHAAAPDRPPQLLDVGISPDCALLYVVDSKGDRVLVTDPNGTVLRELHAW